MIVNLSGPLCEGFHSTMRNVDNVCRFSNSLLHCREAQMHFKKLLLRTVHLRGFIHTV